MKFQSITIKEVSHKFSSTEPRHGEPNRILAIELTDSPDSIWQGLFRDTWQGTDYSKKCRIDIDAQYRLLQLQGAKIEDWLEYHRTPVEQAIEYANSNYSKVRTDHDQKAADKAAAEKAEKKRVRDLFAAANEPYKKT